MCLRPGLSFFSLSLLCTSPYCLSMPAFSIYDQPLPVKMTDVKRFLASPRHKAQNIRGLSSTRVRLNRAQKISATHEKSAGTHSCRSRDRYTADCGTRPLEKSVSIFCGSSVRGLSYPSAVVEGNMVGDWGLVNKVVTRTSGYADEASLLGGTLRFSSWMHLVSFPVCAICSVPSEVSDLLICSLLPRWSMCDSSLLLRRGT